MYRLTRKSIGEESLKTGSYPPGAFFHGGTATEVDWWCLWCLPSSLALWLGVWELHRHFSGGGRGIQIMKVLTELRPLH